MSLDEYLAIRTLTKSGSVPTRDAIDNGSAFCYAFLDMGEVKYKNNCIRYTKMYRKFFDTYGR